MIKFPKIFPKKLTSWASYAILRYRGSGMNREGLKRILIAWGFIALVIGGVSLMSYLCTYFNSNLPAVILVGSFFLGIVSMVAYYDT